MAGSGIAFDVDGLRRGGEQQAAVSAACTAVSQALRAIAIGAVVFGEVPAAAGFHACVSGVRDSQARDAATEASRRGELAAHARSTAGLGSQLTAETTEVARSGRAGSRMS